jgi:hypothetical protein
VNYVASTARSHGKEPSLVHGIGRREYPAVICDHRQSLLPWFSEPNALRRQTDVREAVGAHFLQDGDVRSEALKVHDLASNVVTDVPGN